MTSATDMPVPKRTTPAEAAAPLAHPFDTGSQVDIKNIADSQGNTWATGRFDSKNRLKTHPMSLPRNFIGSHFEINHPFINGGTVNIVNEHISASAQAGQSPPWHDWFDRPSQDSRQHQPLAAPEGNNSTAHQST